VLPKNFNENILEGIESQRKKYINDFISDHQLCAVKVGITYCHPSGQATSAIDYEF
jgi:hypothetical protein